MSQRAHDRIEEQTQDITGDALETEGVGEPSSGEPTSPRPFWSGTISFGLVSIPVNLFPASRSSHVGLRMLASDGTPLRRRYFSGTADRGLGPEQMVRGFEIEEGKYVVVTDEELERLEPEKSRDIDLRRFVPQDAIPPMYFDRSYFLLPAETAGKAYQLLATVMEKSKRVGIATFVMRGKEYLIAILSANGILCAETLRFSDELRSASDIGLPEPRRADPKLVRRFQKLITEKAKPELAENELRDETAARLLAIVKQKERQRSNVVEVPEEKRTEGEVINILDVLKRSLASNKASSGSAGAKSKRESDTHPRTARHVEHRARKRAA